MRHPAATHPPKTHPQSEPADGSRVVPQFLSPSWVGEFNSALEGVVLPGAGPDAGLAAADGRFTVVQEVHGAPDGDLRVILHVDTGTLRLSRSAVGGDADETAADVTIALSYEDAVALSAGELAPAEALNAGRIRVRGDLSVLVAGQQMLQAARVATASLRSSTTY
jgi:putative sterol carrier protein